MADEVLGMFIKFFVWEEKWIVKAIKQRMVEMKWLAKTHNINMLYSLVWNIVPNSIFILSFLTYILLGNKLTVSTAFTAIKFFDMLKMPLNILPLP
ncbi:hypothetical protein M422DRAFT_258308 [Sphaerobolus stellatus SS14]|uniref:ABC transmembrane type-1 domain-containing protein n=1 Tax=Sphaerobolus stellatus (strain SS14) TaxID=990650 RepID=A0A0C9VBM2_SPHS4|nr:hypothetical protein M422DRAFT_258308 [Sphaerobolus stellatus SS14]